MKDLVLNVVTPERSIVNQMAVEAIVLPSEGGQLTLLPGHINFVTTLTHGSFGYKTQGEWQVAFLSGGFTQVFQGKVTVLAETMEMAQEMDLASAELQLQECQNKIKSVKLGSPEYSALIEQKDFALAKIKAVQKKLH
jgi:F-type H+-transporting ATPase subunit epsilon